MVAKCGAVRGARPYTTLRYCCVSSGDSPPTNCEFSGSIDITESSLTFAVLAAFFGFIIVFNYHLYELLTTYQSSNTTSFQYDFPPLATFPHHYNVFSAVRRTLHLRTFAAPRVPKQPSTLPLQRTSDDPIRHWCCSEIPLFPANCDEIAPLCVVWSVYFRVLAGKCAGVHWTDGGNCVREKQCRRSDPHFLPRSANNRLRQNCA